MAGDKLRRIFIGDYENDEAHSESMQADEGLLRRLRGVFQENGCETCNKEPDEKEIKNHDETEKSELALEEISENSSSGSGIMENTPCEARKPEEAVKIADSLFMQGRYAEAINSYEDALKSELKSKSEKSAILKRLAFSCVKKGEFEMALYNISRYEENPWEGFESRDIKLIKSYCLSETGKKEEAEGECRKIMENRDYLDLDALLESANIMSRDRNSGYEKACGRIKEFLMGIKEKKPLYTGLLDSAGRIIGYFSGEGDYDRALSISDSVLSINGRSDRAILEKRIRILEKCAIPGMLKESIKEYSMRFPDDDFSRKMSAKYPIE
ncbi:MAG: hypothetical protein NTV63_01310 [Candidatus Woesearchaeota archaeon]|nr:hypothetical protein [Candidatus Woesearchaeota archaeon]